MYSPRSFHVELGDGVEAALADGREGVAKGGVRRVGVLLTGRAAVPARESPCESEGLSRGRSALEDAA